MHYVELIVRTGSQRLRPVVLTTVTTVFGLLPLASNLSIDFVNRTIEYGSMLELLGAAFQAIVSGSDLRHPADLGHHARDAGDTASNQIHLSSPYKGKFNCSPAASG